MAAENVTVDALIMLSSPPDVGSGGTIYIPFVVVGRVNAGPQLGRVLGPISSSLAFDAAQTLAQRRTAMIAAAKEAAQNTYGVVITTQGSTLNIVGL